MSLFFAPLEVKLFVISQSLFILPAARMIKIIVIKNVRNAVALDVAHGVAVVPVTHSSQQIQRRVHHAPHIVFDEEKFNVRRSLSAAAVLENHCPPPYLAQPDLTIRYEYHMMHSTAFWISLTSGEFGSSGPLPIAGHEPYTGDLYLLALKTEYKISSQPPSARLLLPRLHWAHPCRHKAYVRYTRFRYFLYHPRPILSVSPTSDTFCITHVRYFLYHPRPIIFNFTLFSISTKKKRGRCLKKNQNAPRPSGVITTRPISTRNKERG